MKDLKFKILIYAKAKNNSFKIKLCFLITRL